MNKLLSVVIPFYNAEQYLPLTLDSLLPAELPAVEFILVDDGSTDGSLNICRAYMEKDSRIRIFRQNNSGPSAARNLGIRESRGDYIIFFDADDQLDINAFLYTISLIGQYDAQMWASDFYRIALNGCVLDRIHQIEESDEPINDPAYMVHFLSDGERVWNVWRYIFRRDFLLENQLFFLEGVNCAEDLEFIVRALTCVERPVFFHNPYYYYHAHYGNTLTRQYTVKRVSDLMMMLSLSASFLEDRRDICSRLLRDKLVKEYLLNLALYEELPEEDRPAALEQYKSASALLKQASGKWLRAVCALVRMLGIARSAELLLDMKKVKRWIRRKKIEKHQETNR